MAKEATDVYKISYSLLYDTPYDEVTSKQKKSLKQHPSLQTALATKDDKKEFLALVTRTYNHKQKKKQRDEERRRVKMYATLLGFLICTVITPQDLKDAEKATPFNFINPKTLCGLI